MKKIAIGFLTGLMAVFLSCAAVKDKNTVSGKVESVKNDKDGFTAKVKTAKNEIYWATISIVNVGGPQNYKSLKEGEEVTLKGEIWKMGSEKHIKVTEIVSVK